MELFSPRGVDNGLDIHLEGTAVVEAHRALGEQLRDASELPFWRGLEQPQAASVAYLGRFQEAWVRTTAGRQRAAEDLRANSSVG